MTPRRLCRGALTPCQAAESKETLGQHNITHIVNCQDPKSPNFHEKDPAFTYLRFPIAWWFKSPVFKDKGVKVRHSSGACPSRPCASARARVCVRARPRLMHRARGRSTAAGSGALMFLARRDLRPLPRARQRST